MKDIFNFIKKGILNYYTFFLLTAFTLAMAGLLYSNIHQKEINIKEGQLAEETIRAPKTIENVNATDERKKLAKEAVKPEYVFQSDLEKTQVTRIQQLFTYVTEVNNKAESDYQEKIKNSKNDGNVAEPTVSEKYAALKSKFEKADQTNTSFFQSFSNEFYENLLTLTTAELSTVKDQSISIVTEAMKQPIRGENLANTQQIALAKVRQLTLSERGREAVASLIGKGIVINEVLNETKTKELRQQAESNVTPVMIYQGEVIVREGAQIDEMAMQKMELLGMTNQKSSFFPFLALGILIALQIVMLITIGHQTKDIGARMRYLTFYVVLMILSIAIIKFLQIFQTESVTYIPLLFPAAFSPLILNLFVTRRTGILAAIFQVAFSLFVFYDAIGSSSLLIILVYYLFAGLMPTLIWRRRIGEQVSKALLWLVVFPSVFSILLMVYQGMPLLAYGTVTMFICVLSGCLLSFLLSIGLHPYIELLLNDDSVLALNELSNPNHPLLKQLLEEAPGTYHHSMMVANLSANAVAEIGGRSLLTRVACYYHDIGKIKHANFFVENLPEGVGNPHQFLLPEDSKQIIFGHVKDGVEILEKNKMPKMIIDICKQHHGTTLMRYFFVKAQERNEDVLEEEYRYPGPKPKTREAAVVSIADSAEAAVRAMDHPTNEKIKKFVHDLILNRIADGQLDECGLTMKELKIVEKSIVTGLCSSFHSRIKYPKMKSEAEKMKNEQDERGQQWKA